VIDGRIDHVDRAVGDNDSSKKSTIQFVVRETALRILPRDNNANAPNHTDNITIERSAFDSAKTTLDFVAYRSSVSSSYRHKQSCLRGHNYLLKKQTINQNQKKKNQKLQLERVHMAHSVRTEIQNVLRIRRPRQTIIYFAESAEKK
jgi:hypothetical protein